MAAVVAVAMEATAGRRLICLLVPVRSPCSWEPTLRVVEASQDAACKRFPDHGEPGKSLG